MFRTFLAVCGEHVWPYERTYVLRHRVVSKNSRRPLFLQLPIRLWSRQSQFGQLCACSGTQVPRLVKTAAHRGYTHYICLFLARQPPVGHGLPIHEVSRSHTTTHHIQQDSSGRVISSSQRPLPDNTQHSRQTSMPPVGFEPTISTGERPQTCSVDCAATGIGIPAIPYCKFYRRWIHQTGI